MNYKFGNKNNWRRWLWNRIAERITVPAKDAIVLYLAGEQDLDRQEALRRGFGQQNLIAVDKDSAVVSSLRERGAIAVHDDFITVLKSFSPNRCIDVIVGDFVCGLEQHLSQEIFDLLMQPQTARAVFALNFQRGRDASSNQLREELSAATGRKMIHRGEIFYLAAMKGLMVKAQRPGDQNLGDWLFDNTLPEIFSYKSGQALRFDSLVFLGPAATTFKNFEIKEFTKDWEPKSSRTQRKMSAALAHRTMRMS